MAGSPNEGIGLWRMKMGGEVLRNLGHEVEFLPPMLDVGPQAYLSEAARVITEWEPDIIWTGIINRTTVSMFRRARELGVKGRVFDCDDLYHDVPETNRAARSIESKGAGFEKLFDTILDVTDVMTVTTPFLQDYYNERRGQPTMVCPNVVRLDHIGMFPPPSKDTRLRVGMVYNVNRHADYVDMMDSLRELSDEGLIHMTFFGQFPEHFWKVSPKDVRWIKHVKPHVYWQYLSEARLDVVVNRLAAIDFNIAKSNIKWLEATMVGAATVTTDWGEMSDTPGAFKLSPEDPAEGWATTLRYLATLKESGKLSGYVEVSREAVEAKWTTTSTPVLDAFQKVIDHVEHLDSTRNADGGDLGDNVPADAGERS